MHVVEIDRGGKRLVGRTRKEVETAVKAEKAVTQGHNGGNRRVDEHVVVATAFIIRQQRFFVGRTWENKTDAFRIVSTTAWGERELALVIENLILDDAHTGS